MTKHEIVDLLSQKSGLKRREVLYIVDNFLDSIIKSVDKDGKIELRNFGTFSRIDRKERRIFSPIAGRNLDVPARSVIVFKASKSTEKEIR